MWDLSSPPGIKLASPALQGRFLTIGPPGEYHTWPFKCFFSHHQSEKVQLPIFQYSNSNQAWFVKSSLVSPFYHLFYSIYLAMSGLSCSTQDPWLQCVGSSSLTRDWTWGPCIRSLVLATGPPGKSLTCIFIPSVPNLPFSLPPRSASSSPFRCCYFAH